jgi:hypothetical protein
MLGRNCSNCLGLADLSRIIFLVFPLDLSSLHKGNWRRNKRTSAEGISEFFRNPRRDAAALSCAKIRYDMSMT